MGNTIAEGPNTNKLINDYSNDQLRYGSCEMQGWRKTMEDSIIALPLYEKHMSLFGILDGHGGGIVSKFVAYNFKNTLINLDSYKHQNYEQALKEAFLKIDEYLRIDKVNEFISNIITQNSNDNGNANGNVPDKPCHSFPSSPIKSKNHKPIVITYDTSTIELNQSSTYAYNISQSTSNIQTRNLIAKEMGTTANILLIQGSILYIANAGDSMSVMYKNGKAIKLNREHKATLKDEYARITKSGKKIINKRIAGKLNLTRAIGDLQFKSSLELNVYRQSVTAYPEITKVKLSNDIEFIVMGCDGLWDCVDPQKLCESISKINNSSPDQPLSFVISSVFDQILSKTNNIPIGTDNMSCIIIQFSQKEK